MASKIAPKLLKQTEKPLSSLSKGLELLLKLKELSRPLGLSEAARLLGFNKATTFRVLATLDHTVTMSVLDGVSVIFVERLDGTSRVRVTVEVGSRAAAYASASGKALLAEVGEIEIRRRFKGERLKRFTNTTITSLDRLISELSTVRMRGFATSNEESTKGLCAISAPLRNHERFCVSALTVAFPSGSLTKKEQGVLAQKLCVAATEIEKVGLDNEMILSAAS
jgi:DNA-binding IclR family transcriptional regulator